MSDAAIGLVGVVVGGVLQASGTWLLARRGDYREARGAARLTAGELMRAMHRINWALDDGVWGNLAETPLAMPRWEQHQARFAAAITDDETWFEVYNAYLSMGHVNDRASIMDVGDPLAPPDRDELDRINHLLIQGSAALFAVGFYGPAKWSWRRGFARVRGKFGPDWSKAAQGAIERHDPRPKGEQPPPRGS